MSDHSKGGSHYNNHQRVTELHNGPAHAHTVAAERHDKQDHQTPHEQTRKAQEHSQQAFLHGQDLQLRAEATEEPSLHRDRIAALAYELWQARGCPVGSPDQDWLQAVEQLQAKI